MVVQTYRRFAAPEIAIAAAWRTEVVTSARWKLGNPVGLGESGSYWVVREDGVRAIAKPAFQNGFTPRAAHERIASELARLLDLPVPPVQLWSNPEGGALFALSAFPFRQPLTWDQAQPMLTPAFRQNSLPLLAAGYVFHAWIADTDHCGNGGNVLIDAESTEDQPAIAFIDHAFSMSYQWTAGWGPCERLPGYYGDPTTFPPESIADVVRRVQSLNEAEINGLVDQVPPLYLPPDRAQVIKDCLASRKRELAAAFGLA